MFEKVTPFKQLLFILKLYGLQPKNITKGHKIIVFVFHFTFEFIFGTLITLSIFEIRDSAEFAYHLLIFSHDIGIWLKLIYFFRSSEKLDKFKNNMMKAFEEFDDNFDKALKSSSRLSFVYVAVLVLLAVFSTTFAWFAKSKVLLFWKPPIELDEGTWFILHWIEETGGIYFNILISSVMDLYPLCIIIMLQSYFNKLNQKFSNIKYKKDFIECIEKQKKIKALIQEFEETFSPIIFIRAFMMTLLFGSTLMMLTSTVSTHNKF